MSKCNLIDVLQFSDFFEVRAILLVYAQFDNRLITKIKPTAIV